MTDDCTPADHSWVAVDEGDGPFLMCERCAATVPAPAVAPGVQVVPVETTEP